MKTKTDFDSQPLTAAFAKFSHDREILRSLSSGISNENMNLRRFEYLFVNNLPRAGNSAARTLRAGKPGLRAHTRATSWAS